MASVANGTISNFKFQILIRARRQQSGSVLPLVMLLLGGPANKVTSFVGQLFGSFGHFFLKPEVQKQVVGWDQFPVQAPTHISSRPGLQ